MRHRCQSPCWSGREACARPAYYVLADKGFGSRTCSSRTGARRWMKDAVAPAERRYLSAYSEPVVVALADEQRVAGQHRVAHRPVFGGKAPGQVAGGRVERINRLVAAADIHLPAADRRRAPIEAVSLVAPQQVSRGSVQPEER